MATRTTAHPGWDESRTEPKSITPNDLNVHRASDQMGSPPLEQPRLTKRSPHYYLWEGVCCKHSGIDQHSSDENRHDLSMSIRDQRHELVIVESPFGRTR